ncbi:MAG TPA: tannase/feruloyl esterase family alpha/beta hydrolase [Polyangia bacterium]
MVLDPGAVGFVFGAPPQDPATFIPPLFTLTSHVDDLYASIFATTAVYTQSGESFATPPAMNGFGKKGRRMVLYHGVSDPIFSPEDTIRWFEGLDRSSGAQNVARLFLVPGMGHCSGGPATDQFDLLTPLMRWVEQGEPPRSVTASARGPSNPGGANPDLPAGWSADRTRPLCPFPKVAIYDGGDVERASSFDCR